MVILVNKNQGLNMNHTFSPYARAAILGCIGFAALTSLLGCDGFKSAVSEAKDLAKELQGLERSASCFSAQEAIAKVKAAGPYELVKEESSCKIKAKNLADGESLPAGFTLPSGSGDDCATLEAKFKTESAEWEASTALEVALECDKDAKPTTALSPAHELDALRMVPKLFALMMPKDPREPGLQRCFKAVRDFAVSSHEEMPKLRCEVLKSDAAVAGITSTVLLSRLNMSIDEIDETGAKLKPFRVTQKEAKNKDELESASKRLEAETLSLVKAQQEKFCGKAEALTPAKEAKVAEAAIEGCAGSASGEPGGRSVERAANAADAMVAAERASRRAAIEKAEAEELQAKADAARSRNIPIQADGNDLKVLDGAVIAVKCPAADAPNRDAVGLSFSISNEASVERGKPELVVNNALGAEIAKDKTYYTFKAGEKKQVVFSLPAWALCRAPVSLKVHWEAD